jgi:hypothetical protein
MNVPGPQKNKMELFVHRIYREEGHEQLDKGEVVKRAQRFEFAPDVEVFFKEIPERSYDEAGLIDELNRTVEKQGREKAIGGKLQKREEIPDEWRNPPA